VLASTYIVPTEFTATGAKLTNKVWFIAQTETHDLEFVRAPFFLKDVVLLIDSSLLERITTMTVNPKGTSVPLLGMLQQEFLLRPFHQVFYIIELLKRFPSVSTFVFGGFRAPLDGDAAVQFVNAACRNALIDPLLSKELHSELASRQSIWMNQLGTSLSNSKVVSPFSSDLEILFHWSKRTMGQLSSAAPLTEVAQCVLHPQLFDISQAVGFACCFVRLDRQESEDVDSGEYF